MRSWEKRAVLQSAPWKLYVHARVQGLKSLNFFCHRDPTDKCLIQTPNRVMICEHAAKAVWSAILAAPLIETLKHDKFSKT